MRVRVLAELSNRRDIRQSPGVVEQMVEGDEGVRLSAAVRHLELAYSFAVLARQPSRDIPHQFAQCVRGVSEREELGRVLVDRALPRLGHDLVQVGRELGEREFPGAEFRLKANDLVPSGRVGMGRYRPGHRLLGLSRLCRCFLALSLSPRG